VLKATSASLPVLGKTVIAIKAIGTIIVEPQIKNRKSLLVHRQNANDEIKAALEASGVQDLSSARVAAAQRKEHERRLTEIRKELANLAPGNNARKLAPGLEALKSYLGELRG